MATIKTQLVGGQRRIITKLFDGQRRVSCSCCGCAYEFDYPDALAASYENIDPTINWPEDLNIQDFVTIGTFEEEASYTGPTPNYGASYEIIRVQRDNKKYGDIPRGGGGNGTCARFVCARINYNEENDTFTLTTYPVPFFGGAASQSSTGRNLKELLLQYVPESLWKATRNVLFKIHFWGWEMVYRRVGNDSPPSNPLYKYIASSDTKFKIQYAEFNKIT